jgi:hypothetical protein
MTEFSGGLACRKARRRNLYTAAISAYLAKENTLVWPDVYDPDYDTLAALAEELGLNSWAVEDTVGAAERTQGPQGLPSALSVPIASGPTVGVLLHGPGADHATEFSFSYSPRNSAALASGSTPVPTATL